MSSSRLAADLGHALDATADAFFLLDDRGFVRAANAHAADLCDHPAGRLERRRLIDFLPASMAGAIQSHLEAVIASALPRSFDVQANGGWYAGHAYPSSGGAVLHLHNVTERHNAEGFLTFLADAGAVLASVFEEAGLSRALARLLVPHLADWCVIALRDGAGGFRADAAATRASVRERVLALTDRAAAADPGTRALIAEGLSATSVLVPRRADGSDPRAGSDLWSLAHSIALVPVAGRDGTIGTMALGRSDMTRLFRSDELHLAAMLGHRAGLVLDSVRLYENERRATRLRDDVLAIVAHDLRSPLNAIILGATALPHSASPEYQELHETAKRTVLAAASQINRLLDDLLNAARFEAGWTPSDRTRVPVSQLIDEAVATFRLRAATSGLRLDISSGNAAEVELEIDAPRIVEAVGNVLDNALKYTAPGGSVSVAAEYLAPDVVLSVSDTGSGIPSDALPHLFDRFWQARRSGRAGAGLGLFIARGIVEGHGGRIWAESQPGRGSAFHIALPSRTAVTMPASTRSES